MFAQAGKSSYVCKDVVGNYYNKWSLVNDVKSLKLPAQNGSMKLPKAYNVFVVSSSQLDKHLAELRTKGGTLQLPVPDADNKDGFDCAIFKMENSGTMSAELNAKYPQLVSLKGTSTQNKNNTIRYDYDGTSQKISIIWNGINYLYTPYKSKNKTYYLVFKKTDAISTSRPKNY